MRATRSAARLHAARVAPAAAPQGPSADLRFAPVQHPAGARPPQISARLPRARPRAQRSND
eukprot:8088850-Pyramimonas_sp.AAC.1